MPPVQPSTTVKYDHTFTQFESEIISQPSIGETKLVELPPIDIENLTNVSEFPTEETENFSSSSFSTTEVEKLSSVASLSTEKVESLNSIPNNLTAELETTNSIPSNLTVEVEAVPNATEYFEGNFDQDFGGNVRATTGVTNHNEEESSWQGIGYWNDFIGKLKTFGELKINHLLLVLSVNLILWH